ncbi:MAG: GspH/FimT family protein [Patescibacteria group bacterium]
MSSGFTLIELLLVLAIFLVVGIVVMPLYGNFSVSTQLNEEASQLAQNIRLARTQSLAGFNNVTHGVCFETNVGAPDRYIIYSGASCATRLQTFDQIISLPSVLKLTATFPANGNVSDLNFNRTGIPAAVGTITLTHTTSGQRQITVNELGLAEEN